jgi:hypothetical protein
MKFRKEQAEPQMELPFQGTAALEALDEALLTYGMFAVGLPSAVRNEKEKRNRLKQIASDAVWALPTRRSETLRDISALRIHIQTALNTDGYGEFGVPHITLRGHDVDLAHEAFDHLVSLADERQTSAAELPLAA